VPPVGVRLQHAQHRAQAAQAVGQGQRVPEQVAHPVAAQDGQGDISQHRDHPQRRPSGQDIQGQQGNIRGGQGQQQAQRRAEGLRRRGGS